jgi:ribosome-associated protein
MAKTTRPRTSRAAVRAPRATSSRTARIPPLVAAAADAARDKKATDLLVLDLRKTAAFTDFFLICTGGNPRQVQAIADAVEEALKTRKARPTHVEGHQRAEWILLDYFDFVVHVFSSGARQFYGLERLWGAATRIELADHPE